MLFQWDVTGRPLGSLYEGEVDDYTRELAEAVLRELLSKDDTNSWALAELTRLREEAGDAKEVFALLTRQIDLAMTDAETRTLVDRIVGAVLEREPGGGP